jgi:hypothetical protein
VADSADRDVDRNFTGRAILTAVIGAALAWADRSGAVALLVVVVAVQALFAITWVYGLRLPGRRGAITIAVMASAAADTTVSVWPHGRLGPLAAVLALAVPVLFVHQLTRGAARVRIMNSLGGIALLVVGEVALPALLQVRHDFGARVIGSDVTFAIIVIAAGALVVGFFADMVLAAPRFDEDVARGLTGVVASVVAGAILGVVTLRDSPDFGGGRDVFSGAALGALVALFAVAAAFIDASTPLPRSGLGQRVRPVVGVVLPLAVIAPVAFLLCLAVRP